MDAISSFIQFLFNPKVKIGPKATTVISVLLLLLIADNLYGFSHFYNLNRKLEVVEKISRINKDNSLDSSAKGELLKIQKSAIGRKNIKDHVYGFLFSRSKKVVSIEEQSAKPLRSTRIPAIHFLTATLLWIFLFCFHAVINLTEKELSWGERLMHVLGLFLFYVVPAIVFAFLFNLIPLIMGYPILNYIGQGILNVLCIIAYLVNRNHRLKEWKDRVAYNHSLLARQSKTPA